MFLPKSFKSLIRYHAYSKQLCIKDKIIIILKKCRIIRQRNISGNFELLPCHSDRISYGNIIIDRIHTINSDLIRLFRHLSCQQAHLIDLFSVSEDAQSRFLLSLF